MEGSDYLKWFQAVDGMEWGLLKPRRTRALQCRMISLFNFKKSFKQDVSKCPINLGQTKPVSFLCLILNKDFFKFFFFLNLLWSWKWVTTTESGNSYKCKKLDLIYSIITNNWQRPCLNNIHQNATIKMITVVTLTDHAQNTWSVTDFQLVFMIIFMLLGNNYTKSELKLEKNWWWRPRIWW